MTPAAYTYQVIRVVRDVFDDNFEVGWSEMAFCEALVSILCSAYSWNGGLSSVPAGVQSGATGFTNSAFTPGNFRANAEFYSRAGFRPKNIEIAKQRKEATKQTIHYYNNRDQIRDDANATIAAAREELEQEESTLLEVIDGLRRLVLTDWLDAWGFYDQN